MSSRRIISLEQGSLYPALRCLGVTDPPGGVQRWEGKAASAGGKLTPAQELGWIGSYFGGHPSLPREAGAKQAKRSPPETGSVTAAEWEGPQ